MSETEEVEDGDYESRSPSPNYWWPPSPKDSDEDNEDDEDDVDDEEDEGSDDQHRQHNAFWKGFRAAIKDDQNQDEHEQEDDGRPHSRSRTPRCSSRCKYYPCDRPIRSPRSSSPVVGPYRASESHLLESDYDSDAESDYD